mmetsp:Transcript_76112/g.126856  ORF Transcript_76112/g.126856 Transcript_76112/m.126856 type:complete len:345 (+) Transcript_76112:71-1105(+)
MLHVGLFLASPASFSPSPRFTHGIPTRTTAPQLASSNTVFELNKGRAIDTLRHDYSSILTTQPDFSIFSAAVSLYDNSGCRLQGIQQYQRMFAMLRWLRRSAMTDSEVTHRLVESDECIRMRWSAKLWLRDPAFGLVSFYTLDGVSMYTLNVKGLITVHRLENIVLTGGEDAPVSLSFAWPGAGMAVPEVALPFFRPLLNAAKPEGLPPALQLLQGTAARGTRLWRSTALLRSPVPRSPVIQATMETPMERAAREREEMAEKARRSDAARASRMQASWKLFSGPQPCETSFDCERPLVCCDLLFASVCCSSGMLIPTRADPMLQPQPIPIPVERDDGIPPGYQR